MAKRKPRAKKSLWDKVHDIDPGFATGINTMTDDEIATKLVEMANEDGRIEAAKEDDLDLKRAREELSECNKTYSVPLGNNKLRRKLCLETLQGRGKLAS